MKRIFLAWMLLALLLSAQLSAEEGPKLIVAQDILKFSCQPVCETHQDFSFSLYSQGGEVANLQIRKKEVKYQDGMSLSIEALEVELQKDTVSSEGINITLKIKNDDFLRPGDYTIVLLFKGKAAPDKPVEFLKTITINRPAAEINLEELKDRTIILKRPFFWWSCASGKSTFNLYEKDDKAAISELKVSGQDVFQANTKIQVPGKVEPVIAEADKGLTQCLPVPKQLAVILTFSGLEQTGDFSTGKPFGSLQDYLKAILWGFGVDTGVYGFADVLKKIGE